MNSVTCLVAYVILTIRMNSRKQRCYEYNLWVSFDIDQSVRYDIVQNIPDQYKFSALIYRLIITLFVKKCGVRINLISHKE